MLFEALRRKATMVSPEDALPGRQAPLPVDATHAVLGTSIKPPFPDGFEEITLGLGCFWGAERLFWKIPGVHTTSVGYAGGYTPNPTYEETCSGRTGHTEVVKVVWDPAKVSLDAILKTFWEGHDPTQRNRQGNDVGTQYRSAIYTSTPAQAEAVAASAAAYGKALEARGLGDIATQIAPAGKYYYAETYHQQYLHKNPGGYCGLSGTGVPCSIGASAPTGKPVGLLPEIRGFLSYGARTTWPRWSARSSGHTVIIPAQGCRSPGCKTRCFGTGFPSTARRFTMPLRK